MAAVTVTAQSRPHILGDRRCKFYTLTIADTNTFSPTGFKVVQFVGVSPVASGTAVGVASIVGPLVTFTAAGTVTGAKVMVIGS